MKKILLLIIFIIQINTFCVSIEDQISQLLIFGFQGEGVNSIEFKKIKRSIKNNEIGGLIFFRRNIENQKQIERFLIELNKIELEFPLFLSLDQEGGAVQRLSSKNGFYETPSAFDISNLSKEESQIIYNKMSKTISKLGFNLNFAPVLDLNIDPESPAIGHYKRSYSRNPVEVLKYSEIFINSHHTNNILTCLKHFPGHGSAKDDSHLGFTDITNTWSKKELIPYEALINNSYDDMIMMSHIFNKNIDPLYPASLSKKHIDILRDELHYNGVIISDDLLMGALYQNYSLKEIVVNAINAGNNILLFSLSYKNDLYLVDEVRSIIINAINNKEIDKKLIEESYNKVILLKKRNGGNYEK